MSNLTTGDLLLKNLLEVFGERDAVRRNAVIAEIYTETCTFADSSELSYGREAINAKVVGLHEKFPGFVFRPIGMAAYHHDAGLLHWQFGPAEAAPVVTGLDFILVEDGRIRTLYTFLDTSSPI